MKPSLLLVGCGAMGQALLTGWGKDFFSRISVVTPAFQKVPSFVKECYQNPHQVSFTPDYVLFAVKPSVVPEILPLYSRFSSHFLTVAAGLPLQIYQSVLSGPITRLMPNLAVEIRKGVILQWGEEISSLFDPLGLVIPVKDEDALDRGTAISGSGPAYFYSFLEALEETALMQGFSPAQAASLAYNTGEGALALLKHKQDTPQNLRENVTSPGGTTAAALGVLHHPLKDLVRKAVDAAYKRARELR